MGFAPKEVIWKALLPKYIQKNIDKPLMGLTDGFIHSDYLSALVH